MSTLIDIFLIQAFWLSFSLIGAAVLWVLPSSPYKKGFIAYLKESHAAAALLALFAVGIVLFVPLVAVAYLFQLPIVFMKALYLFAVSTALGLAYFRRRALFLYCNGRIRGMHRRQYILGAVVILLLTMQYMANLAAGADINDDTPIHIARIQLILNMGYFHFIDPNVGYNGVTDIRYSTNVLQALQATLAEVLNVPAYKVWLYSNAFFRLVLLGSIFMFTKAFFPRKWPSEWHYILLIVVSYYGNTYFFTFVQLPHCIVVAWVSLMLCGTKLLLEKNNSILLIVAALLIASTHSITAASCAVFLVLFLAALFAKRTLYKDRLRAIIISIAILSLPVLANAFVPMRSTVSVANQDYGVSLRGGELALERMGTLIVPDIKLWGADYYLASSLIDPTALGVYALLGLCILLLKKVASSLLKKAMIGLIMIALLLAFNLHHASLFAFIVLIWQTKNLEVKILLALIVSFYFIIAYNPIVLTLTSSHIPVWFLARFQDLNILLFVVPILGLLLAYKFIVEYAGLPRMAVGYGVVVLMLVAAATYSNKFPIRLDRLANFEHQARIDNRRDQVQLNSLIPLDPFVRDKIVLTNDRQVMFRMSMITTGERLGMVFSQQSNHMQDYAKRYKCYDRLLEHMKLADLQAAGVDVVVLNVDSKFDKARRAKAEFTDSKPYLHFQQQIGSYRLYTVAASGYTNQVTSICSIPYGH